jgi:hypothetical protein
MMLLAFSVHTETMAAPFVPGSPCNGCTVEIFDHTGVLRTAKNAVFRVSNPQTPNGPAPFLELYNPTLAMIEDCAAKVDSIRKPAPGSVVMNAREYQLSGSNQVVFLIEDCEGGGGPGSGEGGPIDEQDDPSLGPIDDGSGLGCAGSGDVHYTPGMCADLGSNPASVSGPAWQTVTNTLSEPHCNLGYTDSAIGPDSQLVPYDNTYTVMCDEGNHRPEVYVGTTRGDSNWGAYVMRTETCKMKTGQRPSDGTRVVEVIVCPVLSDEAPDEQAIAVQVLDVDENLDSISLDAPIPDPLITGPNGGAGASTSRKNIYENTTAVHTFAADEPVTWTLDSNLIDGISNLDASLFNLDGNGVLTFKSAPDYENPTDSGANNNYNLVVMATDADNNTSGQAVTVQIWDVDD